MGTSRSLIWLPFLFLWFFFWPPGSVLGESGPEKVLFETTLGPVTLDHARHVQFLNLDCIQCHHRQEKERQRCRTCHKKKSETREGDPPSFYQVKMRLCRGCHLEKNEMEDNAKAPIHCEQCHDIRRMTR
jgi:hypothetical protein